MHINLPQLLPSLLKQLSKDSEEWERKLNSKDERIERQKSWLMCYTEQTGSIYQLCLRLASRMSPYAILIYKRACKRSFGQAVLAEVVLTGPLSYMFHLSQSFFKKLYRHTFLFSHYLFISIFIFHLHFFSI